MAHRLIAAGLLAAASLLAVLPARAQAISWTTSFTGVPGGWATVGCTDFLADAPRSTKALPNGDFVVIGCLHNGNGAVTARYSGTTGEILWAARYSGFIIDPSNPESAVAVTADAAGNVIVAGHADRYTSAERVDLAVTKYDGATGAVLWSVNYGHGAGTSEKAWDVATNAAGDVFVTGESIGSSAGWVLTVKLDGQTGALAWEHALPGQGHGTAIAVDAAGDAYVAGRMGDAFRVLKLDGQTAAQRWSVELPGQGEAKSISLMASGHVVVAGSSAQTWLVLKLDPTTGAVLWAPAIASNSFSNMRTTAKVDAAGDVFTVGSTSAGGRAVKVAGGSGTVLWNVALDGTVNVEPASLAVDGQGNLAVAGSVSGSEFRVMRLRGSDGQRTWSQSHLPGPSGTAAGISVGVDASGNVFAAGNVSSAVVIYSTTWKVVKHDASAGTVLWTAGAPPLPGYAQLRGQQASRVRSGRIALLSQIYQGSGSTSDRLDVVHAKSGATLWSVTDTGLTQGSTGGYPGNPRVALDAAGNVAVTGTARSGAPGMRTSKFNGADGTVAWTATTTAPGVGYAIAIDANGHVAALGKSEKDWVVAKYHGATGAKLWEFVLASMGPNSGYHEANAIAMDSAGNVVVAGRSTNASATAQGARTIKLAAATGTVLWDKSIVASTNYVLALDGQDNVVVAGYMLQYPNTFIQVAKYAADGSDLWQRVYTVDGTHRGTVQALAVDAEGSIVVAGYTAPTSPAGATVMRTVKYSATGTELWSNATSSAATSYATATDVAFDGLGNVVVGGLDQVAGMRGTSRTVKYDGVTGALRWNPAVSLPQPNGFISDTTVVRVDSDNAVLLATESWNASDGFKVTLSRVVDADTRSQAIAADFNGSGTADLLWSHDDGRSAIWLMSGVTPIATQEIIAAGTGWSVVQVADFNGDGKADLVWQHTDGRMAIYLMNGTTPTTTTQLLNAGGGWSVIHAPDLDGDGKADLVFQNADGSAAVWLMNGTAMASGASIIGPGTGWSVTKVADFDGDGKADLVWTHTDGRVAIWLMNGAAVKSTNQILNAGGGWSVAHVTDLNGDGKADVVWQHTDGSVALWLMNGAAMATGSGLLGPGTGWSVQRVADFNGDGKGDLLFGHADGRAAIYLMNGLTPSATTQILNAGSGWTAKRTLDLNGDGKADIVFQNANGSTAAWLMNGATMTSSAQLLGTGTGYMVSTAGP